MEMEKGTCLVDGEGGAKITAEFCFHFEMKTALLAFGVFGAQCKIPTDFRRCKNGSGGGLQQVLIVWKTN